MEFLTNLAATLRAFQKHLEQNQYMQIGPQSVYFKLGFMHFDRRTLSLGTILSDRFDHILIGEKIELFTKNSEKGWFVLVIFHGNRFPD